MNTFKTALLLTALTLLLLFIGQQFGGPTGMNLALLFAVLPSLFPLLKTFFSIL